MLIHGDCKRGKPWAKEYVVWWQMKLRCNNPKHHRYSDYGARGIKVCERWNIYENFLADMGRKPSLKHSIDRIDNNGNYEPSNCRWATSKQQASNKRPHRLRKDSKTGHKGVQFIPSSGRFRARVGSKHIGCFATVEEAAKSLTGLL